MRPHSFRSCRINSSSPVRARRGVAHYTLLGHRVRRVHVPVDHRDVSRAHRGPEPDGPTAARRSRNEPGRARDRRRAGQRNPGGPAARAASRDSPAFEGQHRHGRQDDDDRRLDRARGLHPAARRVHRRAAAGGGCGPTRQSQHERMGRLEVVRSRHSRLERTRLRRRQGRLLPKSLRARPGTRRLERRFGCRRGGEPRGGGNRHRNRWLDCRAVVSQQSRWHQADDWTLEPWRRHPHCTQPRQRWPDGPLGQGRCSHPRSDDGRRPAGPFDRPE